MEVKDVIRMSIDFKKKYPAQSRIFSYGEMISYGWEVFRKYQNKMTPPLFYNNLRAKMGDAIREKVNIVHIPQNKWADGYRHKYIGVSLKKLKTNTDPSKTIIWETIYSDLTKKERFIVKNYIKGYKNFELAKKLNVTKQRISSCKKTALNKIKNKLIAAGINYA